MATQLQLRKGNTAQTATFTGAVAEVTVDTEQKTIVVHDGVTTGGKYIATESRLQGAWNTANGANGLASGAYAAANATNGYAVSAYATANGANGLAAGAFNTANGANGLAAGAYNTANAVNGYAVSAYATANGANGMAVSAYGKANTANVLAQSAFDSSNNVNGYATSAYARANSAYSYTTDVEAVAYNAYNKANAAFLSSNTVSGVAQSAYNTANGANGMATGAYGVANTASTTATGANGLAAGAFSLANTNASAIAIIQGVDLTQNTNITAVNQYAQSAYNKANTGGTFSGSVTVSQDLLVSGNLIVTGNVTSTGQTDLVIDDPMIYLANNNVGNLVDIGLVGNFDNGTYQHTGIVRDASDGTWKFFSNVVAEPTSTVDFTYAIYDTLKVGSLTGNLVAQTAVINGVDFTASQATQNTNITSVNQYAASAYARANSSLNLTTGGIVAGNVTANSVIANTSIYVPTIYSTGATTKLELSDIGIVAITVAGQNYGFGASGIESNQGIYGGSFGRNRLSLNNETNLSSTNYDVVKIQTGTDGNIQNEFTFANNTVTLPGAIIQTNAARTSNTFTTGSTSQITVDSFSSSTYRSAKYQVQVTSGTDYHVIELRVVHNGTTTYLAQYGEIFTSSSLGTFDTDISGGNVRLLFTGANSVSVVKVIRDAINI